MSDKEENGGEHTEKPVVKKTVGQVLKDKGLVVVKKDDIAQEALSKSVATEVFNPVTWAQFKEMATTFVKSGALPAGANAEQLIVKMQAGFEMGMKPFEAIRSLYIVNGMIAIGGRDCIRLMRNHGWSVEYVEESDAGIMAKVTKGKESYIDTFTFEEAEQSGWTRSSGGNLKPGWKEGANRNLKLRYAVISKIVKSYIPEVMGSAVDIYEVAQDTIPVISGESLEEEISGEDLQRIRNAQTFAELVEVTNSLKAKYKVRVLKLAYDAKREELE